MYKTSLKSSRPRGLLLLMVLSLTVFACKQNPKKKEIHELPTALKKEITDSISISVDLPAKFLTWFNVKDKYFDNYGLVFSNPEDKERTVLQKIPRIYKNQVISFLASFQENGKLIKIRNYYMITEEDSLLRFRMVGNKPILLKGNSETQMDDLYGNYEKLGVKIFKAKREKKEELTQELDSLHSHYRKRYINHSNNLLSTLNDYHYYEKYIGLNPRDSRIDEFLEENDFPIKGEPLGSLLFLYAKNRIDVLDYKALNPSNHSETYLNALALGLFKFLKFEDNKGDIRYENAASWLRTTDFFKRDSLRIKKAITPLNALEFKSKLVKLCLESTSGTSLGFDDLMKQNKSRYYLIDFWATWCAPCIQGVKEMKNMDIPRNIEVISLSVDKEKDKAKWIKTTEKLEQSASYWLNEGLKENKEFLQFVELQSIPRYILIDDQLNLIDQAFYHPSAPQFLTKLEDIRNYRYW